MTSKKIASAAIIALKDALTNIYWYKADLRSFLTSTISNPSILSKLNWDDYKRNIVKRLIEFFQNNEDEFQQDLLKLMTEVSRINNYSHLLQLEDGEEKAKKAKRSVEALKSFVETHEKYYEENKQIEKRRKEAFEKMIQTTAVKDKLYELSQKYFTLLGSEDPQKRGFILEKVLKDLFEIFDLDPKASFKIIGEQIDGAFTFESTDFLFEAKWQKNPVGAKDLDSLAGKLSRKLDNTLGLYLSINGYSEDGVKAHSSGRRMILLMDGSDIMAVLEGRIDLIQLLLRKRRKAAQTGNIYLKIHEILTT